MYYAVDLGLVDTVLGRPSNADLGTEYYQVALSVIEPSTLEREISAFENTGDNYRKILLTIDALETDESGTERRNVIDWLQE